MVPLNTDNGHHVAGYERPAGASAVVAGPEQLFNGFPMGKPSADVRCSECGTRLSDGDRIAMLAYRTVDTPRWQLTRYSCSDCASDTITTPTLGATDIRLSARLAIISDVGTQQHRLCIVDPDVVAVASPSAGTQI